MVSKMEKIETHFIDDGSYCRLKVDVKTIRKNIVGIKILSYNRKMEFEFDKGKVTDLKSELIDFDDRQNIMKDGFKNVGRKWDDEQIDLLIENFHQSNGDLDIISKEMERGKRGIKMKLIELGLIEKD